MQLRIVDYINYPIKKLERLPTLGGCFYSLLILVY